MKRNQMVGKLIKEGFSEKTLVKMSDKQLKLLSDRIISEQQNNTVNVSGNTPNLTSIVTKLKQGGNNVTVSEEENEISEEVVSDTQIFSALGLVLGAFGAAAFNSGKHYYKEYLKDHPGDKKGAVKHSLQCIVNDAHDTGANISESKELQEWVDLMVENEYTSVTTKNEIMELISVKLQEQGREIEIADPDTETEVEPDVAPPYEEPDGDPYIDPWKEPGTTPDPRPKFEKKHKKHEHLPDFLKFNNIVSSVNESKISDITNIVLKKLKNKSQNGK